MPENYGTPEEWVKRTCALKATSDYLMCHTENCGQWLWLKGDWWGCRCGYRSQSKLAWGAAGDKYLCPVCGEVMGKISIGGCGMRRML